MSQPPNTARIIWIVVFIAVAFVVVLCAGVGVMVIGIFKLMDQTDAHRCGLAMVQHDPAAIRMLGQPIEQKWFTSGNSNSTNGRLDEHLSWTVAGPLGQATVEADGVRSDLQSHLVVRFGRDQQSQTIYSGPFDCPALHERPSK